MTNQHLITPPPELVQQWVSQFVGNQECMPEQVYIARAAAQWGADMELEACCEYLQDNYLCDPFFYKVLRKHRRPKAPSLAEEALNQLTESEQMLIVDSNGVVRRALERLQELEAANG